VNVATRSLFGDVTSTVAEALTAPVILKTNNVTAKRLLISISFSLLHGLFYGHRHAATRRV
jgi:hypothetical protein